MTKATDCVNAFMAVVQAIPALHDRTVFAYNEDDFMDNIKGLVKYPGVAIVYEGMRSVPEVGSTAKVGVSGELVISLILIEQGDAIRSTDTKKVNAINYLDEIRGKIMGTRSPTGHYWHFLVEAPAELRRGMVFWVSRWSTPIQLPPTR